MAAWCPAKFWQSARFLPTSIVATFVAFAGIFGLQAPDAATSWLFGAGLAGLGRYWLDHLIRLEERAAADHAASVLRQILAIGESESRRRRRLPIETLAVGLVCLLLGRASRRRRWNAQGAGPQVAKKAPASKLESQSRDGRLPVDP